MKIPLMDRERIERGREGVRDGGIKDRKEKMERESSKRYYC